MSKNLKPNKTQNGANDFTNTLLGKQSSIQRTNSNPVLQANKNIENIGANLSASKTLSLNTHQALSKIFDKQKVEAEVKATQQITQSFSQVAPKAIADYATTKQQELTTQANQETDPNRQQELLTEADKWREGGAYRVALHTLSGGLSGGVGGAVSNAVVSSNTDILNTMQSKTAQALVESGMSSDSANAIAKAISSTTATAMGAAAGTLAGGTTTSAIIGATTAFTTDMNNRQLHPDEKQKLSSLKLGKSKEEQQKLDAASCYLTHCEAQYAIGSPQYTQAKSLYDQGANLTNEQTLLKGTGVFVYTTTGKFSDKSLDASDQKNGVYLKSIDATSVVYNVKGIPTMPDYGTVSGTASILSGALSINLHNGDITPQINVGSSSTPTSLKPSMFVNAGWIQGGSNAQDTNDFLQGWGGSAAKYIPITPVIGIGGGVNHSYGGKTAVEIGVGTSSGVGLSPLGYGYSKE